MIELAKYFIRRAVLYGHSTRHTYGDNVIHRFFYVSYRGVVSTTLSNFSNELSLGGFFQTMTDQRANFKIVIECSS